MWCQAAHHCSRTWCSAEKWSSCLIPAIHAGLECGIIGERCPGIDMVSYGPTITGAHSPAEQVRQPWGLGCPAALLTAEGGAWLLNMSLSSDESRALCLQATNWCLRAQDRAYCPRRCKSRLSPLSGRRRSASWSGWPTSRPERRRVIRSRRTHESKSSPSNAQDPMYSVPVDFKRTMWRAVTGTYCTI